MVGNHTPSVWRFRKKAFLFLGFVFALNVALFLVLVSGSDPLQPETAYAQDGGTPDDKMTPVDSYPMPFSEGAMPFSLRDPWDKTDLTFYFHNCSSTVPCEQSKQAVRSGFLAWEGVSALTFREVDNIAQADIEIQWTTTHEGLGTPGDVLAFAYFPRYGGDMYFDDIERWTLGDKSDMDLELVATHEIGHALGLGHSEFQSAIMYAYSGFASELGQDDIEAIQQLYGPPATTDTPSPTSTGITSFPLPRLEENLFQASGSITEEDPYNVWTMDFEASQTVTVTMQTTGGNLDPYMGILTQDLSSVLTEDGDNDDNGIITLIYTPEESGTYSLVATRFNVRDGTSTGRYTLTVRVGTDGESPGSTPDNQPPPDDTITWRVTNYADTTICYIYFSQSDETTWGDDRLGSGTVLEDNNYLEWEIERGTYDISAWDCNDNHIEHYEISASRNVEVQVYADHFLVVPLTVAPTTGSTDTPSTDEYTWRISNYTENITLCSIYFSPTADELWGNNRLGADQLNAGFYLEWTLEAGTYDVQVEDCQGNNLEARGIELSTDTELQVYTTEIVVQPLTPVIEETSEFRWRVSNYSDFTLCNIYISPTTDNIWGVDQLGSSRLDAGFFFEIELETNTYDVLVEVCGDGSLEKRNVTLSDDLEIQVYNNRMLVVPLN